MGDWASIPESMGTRSYIVAGNGNRASSSCSHGAGRRHSRTQPKKLFTKADVAEQMKGKVWLSRRAESWTTFTGDRFLGEGGSRRGAGRRRARCRL